MTDRKRDELLEHEADGIRELDNDLPRWWLYGFYVTIAFAVVYLVNYHLLATPVFGHAGMAAEYQAEMAEARASLEGVRAAAEAAPAAFRSDAATLAKGEEIFNGARNLCHTCHRRDLGGIVGPNLTDAQWLHGCSADEMVRNVTTGFPAKGMLPFGSAQALTREEVLAVVSYVNSKRGSNPANPKAIDPERDKACQ